MQGEVHPEIVVGGGMAGLLYAYYFKVPCLAAGVSPPPLCAYLHDTEASRGLLAELGMVPILRQVSHGIFWNGEIGPWPGPADSLAAYFKKTRLHDVEVNEFHRGKGESSQFSIAKLSHVYLELWQRLKLENLLWDFGAVTIGLSLAGDFTLTNTMGQALLTNNVKLACPPEAVGIDQVETGVKRVRNVFDVFRVDPGNSQEFKDILYVCDPRYNAYRVSKLAHDLLLVEHAYDVSVGFPSDGNKMWAELEDLYDVDVVKHVSVHSNFGFYERKYDLPGAIELVGRAATGITKLTHHLLEDFQKTRAMMAKVRQQNV